MTTERFSTSQELQPATAPTMQPQQTPYRFSAEEMRVLKECNRESFYQRSLPLATALSIGTFLGVRSGYLKPHVRFGPTPKVLVATAIGYFLGKFSYQGKCAEKLMRLPNSKIGEMLRQNRSKGWTESIPLDSSFGTGVAIPSYSEGEPEDSLSESGPIHDLYADRPINEGLDDTYRPSLDSVTPLLEEDAVLSASTQVPPTTYEELRRKNREEYEQRKTRQFRGVTSSDDIPTVMQPRKTYETPSLSKDKNKYGDVWEE